MRLYLVRHAIAAQPDPERWPNNADRPLTKRGRRRFRRVARGLGKAIKAPDTVLSSPAVRAWDTAGILHRKAGWPEPQAFPALWEVHSAEALLEALAPQAQSPVLALVGHEPLMGQVASFLLTGGDSRLATEWKKGGVMCLECGALEGGSGRLVWFVLPAVAVKLR